VKWYTLILLMTALSVYSPFVNASSCAASSCCVQMEACCGHCACPEDQSCSVAKPAPLDQQAVARTAHAPDRTERLLFSLSYNHLTISLSAISRHGPLVSDSPPVDSSRRPRAQLCVWLI
jgi:hypothetical protein